MSKYFGKFFGPSTRAPKFLTQLPNFLLSKFASQFKVNSICVAGRDTWNLHHKFNSQGPALRILGLRVAISKSHRPISRVLGIRVLCSRVPVPGSCVWGSCVPGSQNPRVLGPRVPGVRVLGPQISGSRFSRFWDPGSQVVFTSVLVVTFAFKPPFMCYLVF